MTDNIIHIASLHIGAATLAKVAGVSDIHIKLLGCW